MIGGLVGGLLTTRLCGLERQGREAAKRLMLRLKNALLPDLLILIGASLLGSLNNCASEIA